VERVTKGEGRTPTSEHKRTIDSTAISTNVLKLPREGEDTQDIWERGGGARGKKGHLWQGDRDKETVAS